MKTLLTILILLTGITANAQTWTTSQLSVRMRALYKDKTADSIRINNLQIANANLANQISQLSKAIVFNKSWSDSLYRSIGTIYLDTTRSVSFGNYLDTIYIKMKQ